MTAQPDYDLDLKLAELKINGYVTFEDLIPVETVDRIREAFLPLLDEVKAHSTPGEDVKVRGHTDDRLVVEGVYRSSIVTRCMSLGRNPSLTLRFSRTRCCSPFSTGIGAPVIIILPATIQTTRTPAASTSGGIEMRGFPEWFPTSA